MFLLECLVLKDDPPSSAVPLARKPGLHSTPDPSNWNVTFGFLREHCGRYFMEVAICHSFLKYQLRERA
jgi:hypothetical protein